MRTLKKLLIPQKEAEKEITDCRALPTWLSSFFFAQIVASLHEIFDNRVDRMRKRLHVAMLSYTTIRQSETDCSYGMQ